MKYLNLGILLVFFTQLSAQTIESENNSSETLYQISFGETLPENVLKREFIDQTIWTITNSADSILFESVDGNSLKNIKFNQPGNYFLSMRFDESIHKSHADECFHPSIPKTIKLEVSPYKLVYLMEEISFSSLIKGGFDAAGTNLEVPVIFSSFDNKPLQIKDLKVSTSGVNTEIKGVLMNNVTVLIPGSNKLVYSLSGKASKESYIMFDFVDINQQTHTYYYPEKLN